jgi:quinoprotein glucose dehydrogenase
MKISSMALAATAGAALLLAAASPVSLHAQPPNVPADAGGAATAQAPDNVPLVPAHATWDSFHGQLNAQKYSPLTQITAANVRHLEKVWEFHTGDVSDGSGKVPATVWSATPVFANDTIYIGTPFYRLIALDPATGKPKWIFDTHTPLKATTQPVLKNRGVPYRAA